MMGKLRSEISTIGTGGQNERVCSQTNLRDGCGDDVCGRWGLNEPDMSGHMGE